MPFVLNKIKLITVKKSFWLFYKKKFEPCYAPIPQLLPIWYGIKNVQPYGMRFAADLIKIKKNRVKRLNTLNEKIIFYRRDLKDSILTSKCFCLTLTVFSWAGTCTVFNLQTFEFIIRRNCFHILLSLKHSCISGLPFG